MSDRKYWAKNLLCARMITRAAVTCLVVLATAPFAFPAASPAARTVITPDPSIYATGSRIKVENDRIIVWAASSELSRDHQIQVFDLTGRELLSLNLLGLVPGAREITISDASVSPNGALAIGTEAFTGKDHGRPFILVLDSAGSLYNSIGLQKVLGVSKIEIDDDESVWVLGLGAGAANPSKVPALTKLGRDGSTLGEFLYFSELPTDSHIVHEGLSVGGDAAMGLTPSKVWIWLPSKRELLTLGHDGSKLKRLVTDLPVWPGAVTDGVTIYAQKPSWLDSGNILAQVTFRAKSSNEASAHTPFFEFAAETNSWREFKQSELASHGGIFLGVDNARAVFAAYKNDTSTIEVEWVPLTF